MRFKCLNKVISRIIKVEVSVISSSRRLRLITLTEILIIPDIKKTEFNNCFIKLCLSGKKLEQNDCNRSTNSYLSSCLWMLFSQGIRGKAPLQSLSVILCFEKIYCPASFQFGSIFCSVEEANRQTMNFLRCQMPLTLLSEIMHYVPNLQIRE